MIHRKDANPSQHYSAESNTNNYASQSTSYRKGIPFMTSTSSSSSTEILVTQIFYPRQILSIDRPAYLIGWNSEQFQCTIAAAITLSYDMLHHLQRSSASILAEALRLCYEDRNFPLSAHHQCPYHPIVLGQWIPSGISGDFIPEADFQTRGIWVTLTKDTKLSTVSLHSVYSLGCRYDTANYLVSFDMPNTDLLNSINLHDPFSVHAYAGNSPATTTTSQHAQVSKGQHGNGRKVPNKQGMPSSKPSIWKDKSELEILISQINAAYDLEQITWYYLHQMLQQHLFQRAGVPNSPFSAPPANSSSNGNNNNSSSSNNIQDYSWIKKLLDYWILALQWLLLNPVLQYVKLFSAIEYFILKPLPFAKDLVQAWTWEQIAGSRVLHRNMMQSSNKQQTIWNEDAYRYVSVSYFGNDLYFKIHKMKKLWKWIFVFTSCYHVDHILRTKAYLRVLNGLLYQLVDVSLGLTVSYYAWHHLEDWVLRGMQNMYSYQFDYILPTLDGLNHAPMGIKLNTLITTKIGAVVEFVIRVCYLHEATPGSAVNSSNLVLYASMKFLLRLMACLGGLGLTAQLAIFADLWTLFCLPMYCLHVMASYGILWHSRLLTSLWHLFYGRKNNILRNRVDSLETFDQELLLFAVIFFTIMFFLWPNFVAFYLLLASIRMTSLLINYSTWLVGMEIKYCPYNKFTFFTLRQLHKVLSVLSKINNRVQERYSSWIGSGNRLNRSSPSYFSTLLNILQSIGQYLSYLISNGLMSLLSAQGMIDDGIDIKVQQVGTQQLFSTGYQSKTHSNFDVGLESLIRDMSPKTGSHSELKFFQKDFTVEESRSEDTTDFNAAHQYLSASVLKGHEGINQRSGNQSKSSNSFWSSFSFASKSSLAKKDDEHQNKSKLSNDAVSESTENISIAQPEKVSMPSMPPPIKRVVSVANDATITHFHIQPTTRGVGSLFGRHNLWFAHFHRKNNLFLGIGLQFISSQPLRMHLPYLSKLLLEQVQNKENAIMQNFLMLRLEHLHKSDQILMRKVWLEGEESMEVFVEMFRTLLKSSLFMTQISSGKSHVETFQFVSRASHTRYLVTLSTVFYTFQIVVTFTGLVCFLLSLYEKN